MSDFEIGESVITPERGVGQVEHVDLVSGVTVRVDGETWRYDPEQLTSVTGRPFRVGDTVKITDYDVMTGKTIRTHTGKIRSLKDVSASNASDWVTCIADVDEPYLMGKSDTLHTVAIVHLIPIRTQSTWPSNQTIELLEPVASTPDASADHGPLAAHLSDRTLAKVLSRPAHVPRETPSLVELDRRDEMRSLLAEAIYRSTGGVGRLHDVGHTYAIDPFGAAEHILARFQVKAVQS